MIDESAEPRGELTTSNGGDAARHQPQRRHLRWLADVANGHRPAASPQASGARSRVVTVAVEGMVFHKPVHVGNVVCCYTEIQKVGTTSITLRIEAWALRRDSTPRIRVTEGIFTYVALDEQGRKHPVPPEA